MQRQWSRQGRWRWSGKQECEKEVNNGVGTVGMKNEGDAWGAIRRHQCS